MKKALFTFTALFATIALFAAPTFPEATFPEATFPEATFPEATFPEASKTPSDMDNYLERANEQAKAGAVANKKDLSMRMEVGYQQVFSAGENASTTVNQLTMCAALIAEVGPSNVLKLIIDEPCAQAAKKGFNDKDSVQDVTVTLYLDNLGKYTSGNYQGQAFFYTGTPKQSQFKKEGGLFTLTLGLRPQSEVTSKLFSLNLPKSLGDVSQIKAFFKQLGYTTFKELPTGDVCDCSKEELLAIDKKIAARK